MIILRSSRSGSRVKEARGNRPDRLAWLALVRLQMDRLIARARL